MTAFEFAAAQKSHLMPQRLSAAQEAELLELADRGIDPEDDDE